MPKVKVPDRIRELGCEQSQHREDINTELADLGVEMMEQTNDQS